MKKTTILILALLLLGAPLFAQEDKPQPAKPVFTYGGMMYLYNVHENYFTATAPAGGEAKNWISARFRQYFGVKMGQVETMVKLEMDPNLGGNDEGSAGSGDIGLGADNKAELQIKNAYLKFAVPNTPITVTGGIFYYGSPGNFIFTDDIPGVLVSFKQKNMSANLLYSKFQEDDKNDNSDDADFFGADLTIKMGNMSISPAIYLGRYGADSFNLVTAKMWTLTPMVNFKMDNQMFALDATAALGFGKVSGGDDLSGLGLTLKGTLKLNKGTKISLVGYYMSGNDASTTDKTESFAYFMPGWYYSDKFTKSVFLTQSQIFLQGGLMPLVTGDLGKDEVRNNGLFLLGIDANINMGKLCLNIKGSLINTAQDNGSGKKYCGIEAGVTVSYELVKDLKLIAQAAVFLPGSDYETVNHLESMPKVLIVGTSFKW